LEVSVYTRSTAGANFSLLDATTKASFGAVVAVKHSGTGEDENEASTCVVLNKDNLISGPCKVKVHADSEASRFSTHNYLLVFSFKEK
jgi:hypothetical protein